MISSLAKGVGTLRSDEWLQKQSQHAANIGRHWIVRLGAHTFLLQYLALIVTGGNTQVYRIVQVTWLALALFTIILFWKKRSPPSLVFLSLLAILIFGTGVSIVNIATGIEQSTQPLIKIGALVLLLSYFDGFRFLGLTYFMQRFALSAALMIVVSILHFWMDPSFFYGRYLFFGLHPNLGGEFLFAAVLCIVYLRSKAFFLLLTILALVGIFYLEARSALVGVIVFLALYSFFSGGPFFVNKRTFPAIVFFGGFATILLLIVLLGMSVKLTEILRWISNDLLLMNDQYRGVGSGVSGRFSIIATALESFGEHVLFGVGLDNATINDGKRVHFGPLVLLTEFGVLGIVPTSLILLALARNFRHDRVAFSALAGSIVLFIFQARGLNLNIFPVLMWIMVLPWPKHALSPSAEN